MDKSCDACLYKQALTKCRKGKFCKACGEKCHAKYEHEVQFIIHAPQDERGLNYIYSVKGLKIQFTNNYKFLKGTKAEVAQQS